MSKKPKTIETPYKFTINASSVREESMDGRDYYVCPVVLMTEGVHSGNMGPIYYPEQELDKSCLAWNNKPVVLDHPKVNGQYVSAGTKDILSQSKLGFLLNTSYEEKQKAEAWIDKVKTEEKAPFVINAIKNGTLLEVSTGLGYDADKTKGDFNGESYDVIARNHRPDHLAILSDSIGACSIKKGAGLLANEEIKNRTPMISEPFTINEMSFEDIRCAVRTALASTYGEPGKEWYGYIYALYPDYVIFEKPEPNGGYFLYRVFYSIQNGVAVLETRSLSKVVTEITYVTANQESTRFLNKTKQEKKMALNSQFEDFIKGLAISDEEKATLSGLPETILSELTKKIDTSSLTANKKKESEKKKVAPEPEPVVNTQKTLPELLELITNHNPELGEALSEAVETANDQKQSLIAKILANKANEYTAEELVEKSMKDLKKMAKIAEAVAAPVVNAGKKTNFGLAGVAAVNGARKVDVKPLPSVVNEWFSESGKNN